MYIIGCQKMFIAKPDMVAHVRLTHSNNRPCICLDCGYRAKTQKTLDQHMAVHKNEKNYNCPLCTFSVSTSIKYNLLLVN